MNTEKQIVGEWTTWPNPISSVDPDAQVIVCRRNGNTWWGPYAALMLEVRMGRVTDIVAYAVVTPYVAQPWRAEHGQEFWYVTTGGKSHRWTERFDDFCNRAYEAGNYYQT